MCIGYLSLLLLSLSLHLSTSMLTEKKSHCGELNFFPGIVVHSGSLPNSVHLELYY